MRWEKMCASSEIPGLKPNFLFADSFARTEVRAPWAEAQGFHPKTLSRDQDFKRDRIVDRMGTSVKKAGPRRQRKQRR